jgi:hypothetical protein
MRKQFLMFITYLILVTTVALFDVGCKKKPTGPEVLAPAANLNSAAPSARDGNPSVDTIDKGDLKLKYLSRKKARNSAVPTAGSNEAALQQIIHELNDQISLPFDIYVYFENCEQPDASYDPETHQLKICYELIDDYYALFSPKIKDKAKLDEAVRGATASTFFHELGHGLVDAWKIPITGREEDAVDQLSTLVLINRSPRGEQMALDGALSFKLYANLGKGQKKIFWDEHSLDEQRFYDTICLIYGHDPEKYGYLVEDGSLPEERAEICVEDYAKVRNAWTKLLAPYVKQPPKF